jgi:hypothetical protein
MGSGAGAILFWLHSLVTTPKQALVKCIYFGWCPKCTVHPNNLGDCSRSPLCNYNDALEAFQLDDGDVHTFHSVCLKAGLKPVFHPFWEALHSHL